jgi:DNA (cytosine-5)-methyltransferase 1
MHLFAGAGGGILADLLLGHRPVCAVEIDAHCQKVLLQRQRDGFLPAFPIWDDVVTFDGEPWKGAVEIVAGGFPCTNISCAGPRDGLTGESSILFFQMLRIIEEVQPRFVFTENSPELRTKGLGAVVTGLTSLGYECRWCVLGARDVGANHVRKRLWLLAYSDDTRERNESINAKMARTSEVAGMVKAAADADSERDEKGELLVRETQTITTIENGVQDCDRKWDDTDTDSKTIREQPGWRSGKEGKEEAISRVSHWWDIPRFAGMDDGMPNKMDRVRATGNMQVPAVAALAWRILRGETK